MDDRIPSDGFPDYQWPCEQNEQAGNSNASRQFEYDPVKSVSNKEKHGIGFEEARALWNDGRAMRSKSKYSHENREILISKYDGKHCTAIYAFRKGKIRIISVRRSRTNEVNDYEKGY